MAEKEIPNAKPEVDPSVDPATLKMIKKAEDEGVSTVFERAATMKACPIGAEGSCCSICAMGPCRVPMPRGREETEEDTTRVVVRLTFPLTSGATVAAGATPNVLIVKMTPGSSGAAVPLSARAGPSEATRADVRTLYIVGGLILLIGTGVVVGYLLLSGSGRKRARTAAVGVPAEEAKSLMREDVDAYRETSDAALDASHERHQRLVRIVRQDMSEMRLEMKSLGAEFERATQSVLLFGEPFVARPDDSPTELDGIVSPQAVAGGVTLGADTEASSESVATEDAEGSQVARDDSPYARARRLVQEGADLAEVGRITGLSSAELDLLARLGRMQSSRATQGSHAE